jgi:hypothetical protein
MRKPGFAPGLIHVGFVPDKVALGQVFLRALRFSPVNIIPPSLSMRIYHLGDEQYERQWQQFRDVVSADNKSKWRHYLWLSATIDDVIALDATVGIPAVMYQRWRNLFNTTTIGRLWHDPYCHQSVIKRTIRAAIYQWNGQTTWCIRLLCCHSDRQKDSVLL